ncbi:RDD family protein [Branchiibius sp. NY16-3462-2]|uniref:RDD family protein n=1 Tax=Branchiibius sp. NY16-3462-2 TaxID=1807500 RepID=UPI000797FCB2|nr:RDD family protein [Branchiibius sp. NY16-3462-2]KYH43334.1 hypothetical protein AZH51_13415 [Branchiibius sp. NY16-3462-2]
MNDARPSGWYDDPNDPNLLRYWDGVSWSNHTMPRVKPDLERSSIGTAPDVPDPAQQQPGYGQPGQPPQGQWAPYAPPIAQAGTPKRLTPDGAVLAGWWKRVLGYIIDNLLVSAIAIAITWASFSDWLTKYQTWFDDTMDRASSGSSATLPDPPGVPWQSLAAILIISAVYEIALVAWRGQTLGHMAAGIRVRRLDSDRPPDVASSGVRWVVKQAGSLLGALPVLAFFGSLFQLINYLFPLWDKLSQALHDKAARTYIVRNDSHPGEHQAKTW